MDDDSKKPFKIKDVTRNIKKAVVASSLEEIRSKVAEKFERHTNNEQLPTIHLDSDGTEIDDEEYFRTLDANTELIAVFPGEHWMDATHYVTITSHRDSTDTTDAAFETARIKQLVGQLQNNLCNVSAMNDQDLESLSNMDPNSLVDITGKEFMEQLKDSGRPLCAKRNAQDRINLLKLLKDGAIFCSERYPEEAEAIDLEISRQLNMEATSTSSVSIISTTNTSTTSNTSANPNQNHEDDEGNKIISQTIITTTRTIEENQNAAKDSVTTTTIDKQLVKVATPVAAAVNSTGQKNTDI